jgi:Uma2 family endonuclease
MPTEATKKLFTVKEYYKIAEAGVLSVQRRTELVEGEILEMTGMGVAHAMAISHATRLFARWFENKAEVRIQLPLPLGRFSEFEPDLCLVRVDRPAIETRHPLPSEVFLVLEIADSSLRYDRDIKLPIYAAAGVAEVWISDLLTRRLDVFREPSRSVYKSAVQLNAGDSVCAIAFPEIAVPVLDLVGPFRA